MPTRTFAITAASEMVTLDDQGRGEISFTASNTGPKSMPGRAKLVSLGSTKADWLSLAGEQERNFAKGEAHQFTVKIAAPRGTPTGKYSFRLNIISVENPDDEFTEGPSVSFEVKQLAPAVPPPRKFPWWIVAVAGVVVLGAGIITWLLLPPKVAVPEATPASATSATPATPAASTTPAPSVVGPPSVLPGGVAPMRITLVAAKASSQLEGGYNGKPQTAERLLENEDNTFWNSDDTGKDPTPWFWVKLDKPSIVQEFMIRWKSNFGETGARAMKYRVLSSLDGTNWTYTGRSQADIPNLRTALDLDKLAGWTAPTLFIKVEMSDSSYGMNGYFTCHGVEVWGVPAR